jgi:magnesium transporter
VADVLEGLDRSARERIKALRGEGRFFWIDVSSGEAERDDIREALSVPEAAFGALFAFGDRGPRARKLFARDGVLVFPFTSYLESVGEADGTQYRLHSVEVHVLVSRDYVLTLHEERFSLPARLAPYLPEGRSDQYTVYAVVEAMVATAFEALNEVELTLDALAARSTALRGGRVRMATLSAISSRLSRMRRRVAPERGLFERIGIELTPAEGPNADDQRYFDQLGTQVSRLVDGIDAASAAMATLIELRLNETTYWLTVVATIFLPLTFITGFFGMNFEWMVDAIDTQLAFWLLGVVLPAVGVALIVRLIMRGSPVDDDADGGPRRRRVRSARRARR